MEMEKIKKIKFKISKIITISLIILFSTITIKVSADQITLVIIDPSNQTVSSGETFSIDVKCVPGQPMKSYEFQLLFNPSLIQVNSVTEGDIFDGYTTYFNAGTINNVAGAVIDIYGLIVGDGNVSDSGSFVTISCTALDITGSSVFDLFDVGVTNETAYINISVTDGTVQIDATSPQFYDNSPSTGTTGDSYTFNVSVNDSVDPAENLTVKVDWYHGSQGGNQTMAHVGGNYFEKTISLDSSSISDMTYIFYANDTNGNSEITGSTSVTVIDNDYPQILEVSSNPVSQNLSGSVNITVDVTDNIGISNVYLNILYPNSNTINLSIISNNTGFTYYCNRSYSIIGPYSYSIWVYDTSGNSVSSSNFSFSIGEYTPPEISNVSLTSSSVLDTDPSFGWVNITCDVTDNVEVCNVTLNITNPDGSWCNVSMNAGISNSFYYNSSVLFSTYGNYSYQIVAGDNSNNYEYSIINDFSMPPNWDINIDGDCNIYDLVCISSYYNESSNLGWIREDFDNNGQIQVIDLVLISGYYDESWYT
jgi:hypothetical protein